MDLPHFPKGPSKISSNQEPERGPTSESLPGDWVANPEKQKPLTNHAAPAAASTSQPSSAHHDVATSSVRPATVGGPVLHQKPLSLHMTSVPSHLLDESLSSMHDFAVGHGHRSPANLEPLSPQSSHVQHPPHPTSASTGLAATAAPSVSQRSAQNQQRDPTHPSAPSCLLPTPIRPSNSVLPTDGRTRGQSVSFCDPDGAEKSRRFTISAQPSAVNLASGSRQGSQVALPQRKASTSDHLPSASRNGSVVAINSVSRPDTTSPSVASSRVESPVSTEQPPNHSFHVLNSRLSPSPPPVRSTYSSNAIPSKSSPKSVNHSTFSVDIPGSASSRRSSRQGSDVGTNPISISRKNSQTKKSNKTLVASPVGPPVPFQQYLLKEDDKKVHVLLACTGSVATIKVPMIIDKLFQIFGANKISVQLVVTKAADHFLKGLKIQKDVKIWRDEDEWANFTEWNLNASAPTTTTPSTSESKKQKNPWERMILHNELRKWADLMLLAPLSANTLAKIANGISDNLLTSIIRGWGSSSAHSGHAAQKKPIFVAPAMNTLMYTHPLTSKQLKILSSNEEGFGMEVLKPVEKVLVCGDIGMGGMREWQDIVETVRKRIKVIFAARSSEAGEMALDEDDEDEDDEDEDADGNDGADDDDDDDEDDEDDEEEDEEGDTIDNDGGKNDEVANVIGAGGSNSGFQRGIFGFSEDESQERHGDKMSKARNGLASLLTEGKPVTPADGKEKQRKSGSIDDFERTVSPCSEEAKSIL